MAPTDGIEASHPPQRDPAAAQPAVRYLVLIDTAGGGRVARMFLTSLEEVAEFDAAAPEVAWMIDGLLPSRDGLQPQWYRALAGHSEGERSGAEVYTFDV